jgi:hypothetical protein
METDRLVQLTIPSAVEDATVLTIAHMVIYKNMMNRHV